MKGKLGLKGRMKILLKDKDGNIKLHEIHDNLIVDIGITNVRDLLLGTGSALSHLGIGWGTGADTPVAAGQINFQGTDQDRQVATTGTPSDDVLTLEYEWAAGTPSGPTFPITLYEFGVFWDGGVEDNEMFSRIVRSGGVSKDSDDSLKLTYTLTLAETP